MKKILLPALAMMLVCCNNTSNSAEAAENNSLSIETVSDNDATETPKKAKLPTSLDAFAKAAEKESMDFVKYLVVDIDKDGVAEVFAEDEDGAQMAFSYYDGKYHELVETETMEENLFYTEDGFVGVTFDFEEGSVIWSYKLENGRIGDCVKCEMELDEEGEITSTQYYIGVGETYDQVDEAMYKEKAPQKDMKFVRGDEKSWKKR